MALNWAEKFKVYLWDIWFLWGACLILNIITFFVVYFKIRSANNTFALHTNVLVGVEWYGSGRNLYFIPAIGLVLCGANLMLYRALKNNQNFFSALTVFVSLCVQIILLAAAVYLVSVN